MQPWSTPIKVRGNPLPPSVPTAATIIIATRTRYPRPRIFPPRPPQHHCPRSSHPLESLPMKETLLGRMGLLLLAPS